MLYQPVEFAAFRYFGRSIVYGAADAVLPGSKPVVHGAPGYARYFRLTAFLAGVFYRLCLLRGNMGRYSVVYGSIGAAIVLLLWLYFSAITLIMGAELNYLLVNRPSKKAGRQQKVKK